MRGLLVLAAFAVAAYAADMTGTWSAAVETDAGNGNPTFVLKQSGEELSGTYSGALGEAKVKGTIKGDKVEISFSVSPSGEAFTVVYTGTLEGDRKMKGTVKLGPLGDGTFTAEKK